MSVQIQGIPVLMISSKDHQMVRQRGSTLLGKTVLVLLKVVSLFRIKGMASLIGKVTHFGKQSSRRWSYLCSLGMKIAEDFANLSKWASEDGD